MSWPQIKVKGRHQRPLRWLLVAVDGYGGMTMRHNARDNDDSIWLDRAVATTDDRAAIRAPATKASHGGLGDDVLDVVEMFAKELTSSDVGKLNR